MHIIIPLWTIIRVKHYSNYVAFDNITDDTSSFPALRAHLQPTNCRCLGVFTCGACVWHVGVFVWLCSSWWLEAGRKRGDVRCVCPQIYLTSIPAHTHSDCFALTFTSSKITSNRGGQVALLNSYSLSLHSHSRKHIRRQRCQLLWTATLFNLHFDTHTHAPKCPPKHTQVPETVHMVCCCGHSKPCVRCKYC